jgi:hypothetical protein
MIKREFFEQLVSIRVLREDNVQGNWFFASTSSQL